MIADVAFDLPLDRAFAYRVPETLKVLPGQRVKAPLQRGLRSGVVTAVREGDESGLETIESAIDDQPLLSHALLRLTKSVAGETASAWGEVLASALPPASAHDRIEPLAAPRSTSFEPRPRTTPKLLTGKARHIRLLEQIAAALTSKQGVLLLAPEIEDAEAWALRLKQELSIEPLCLHSRRGKRERRNAWAELLRDAGKPRCVVGTRSAVFAPLESMALLAVTDEHDLAYKSPETPRYHARDVARLRVEQEGGSLCLTSATPSVESWWRSEDGQFEMLESGASPWPTVSLEDLRGDASEDPFSDQLRETIAGALGHDRQVLLLAARLGYAPALTCAECGFTVRCFQCGLVMNYRKLDRTIHCRLCGRTEKARALCLKCRGRQITAAGWGTERVEEMVRAAFPKESVIRYDSTVAKGKDGKIRAQAIESGSAHIVVGTRSALRWFRPGRLGAVGVIGSDSWIQRPDFRASERAWQLLWEACERLENGTIVIQTRHPEHYVMTSLAHQDKAIFYRYELKFRAELGYPPFTRLARVAVRGANPARSSAFLRVAKQALIKPPPAVTVYPESRWNREWQMVIKGDHTMPEWVRETLLPLRGRHPSGVRLEVEIDPMELA
jgi:primosomal protein N' (replication factor Y)